jgi:hypothetical protein
MACRNCGQRMVLRISIDPAPGLRFIFACPGCTSGLRLQIETPGPPVINVKTEDLDQLDPQDESDGLPIILLTACIPIHVDLLGRQTDSFVSPFLAMSSHTPMERVAEYSGRSNSLQDLHERLFPSVRRLASLYQAGDIARLQEHIDNLPFPDDEAADGLHAVYKLGRFFDVLYLPVVDLPLHIGSVNEVLIPMVKCYRERRAQYKLLLDEFVREHSLFEHRRKVVASALTIIDHMDALLPGLAWESFDPTPDAKEFRVVRDDFDTLRARYVEVFELGSRSLVYIGAIANLAYRSDPTNWSDGTVRSVRATMQLPAHKREFILGEFPLLSELYQNVHRSSRNQFGHYSVEYDYASGELVDNNGQRTNYVLFLADYLAAARLVVALLSVVEKLTLDHLDTASPHRALADLDDNGEDS